MKKKTILLVLLMVLTTGILTGCDPYHFNESKVSETTQRLEPIIDGEYTILDTREQISGNNIRVQYHLTIVLQNANGNRFYYEYTSRDEKNTEYIKLAKFVPNDKVTYKNGYFALSDEFVEEKN